MQPFRLAARLQAILLQTSAFMHDNPVLRRRLAITLGTATLWLALWRLLPGEAGLYERIYCASLVFALALFVAVASGRFGFGLLSAGAAAGCVWLAGALKLAYLHEPLLAPDLRYFTSAATVEVIAHYPALWRKCAIAVLGGLFLAGVVWWLESPAHWRDRRWRTRGGFALLALLPLALVAWPRGPFRDVYAIGTWNFIAHARLNPTTAFLLSFTRMSPVVPAWTPDAARKHDWGAAAPSGMPGRRPDLVAVLEESTLDPRQWAACTTPRCHVPMFDSDHATNAHGLLKVHTYGGATWTSEFAFLSGMPHLLFGAAGIYAPYNLAPRMRESLPRQLKALGYRTIAIYPMPRDFVRAGGAYADYGFDAFHDAQELGLDWDSTDADLVQRFKAIHARERATDDRPLFFMLLTMRQHGPHDQPLDTLPPPWNQAPLATTDARLDRNLGNYLFRLHQSSDALLDLRRYLFAPAARPAVLVHFGDHRPAFDGLESSLASALPPELRAGASQTTYYRIDSNFAGVHATNHRTLDLAYLGGLLLDVAGLPKNAYFEANTRLRERCSGRFMDCPDAAVYQSWLARAFGELDVFAY